MAYEFQRNIQDASARATQTKAFAAAGADNDSTAFDLGAPRASENMELEIAWPDLPNLVDAKTIIFTVYDSADNSSFTTLGLTHTITGAGGVGVAAGTKRFRLPGDCRRYVRWNQATLAAGGDNTASVSTGTLRF